MYAYITLKIMNYKVFQCFAAFSLVFCFFIKCDLVNISMCCSGLETFVNGSCTVASLSGNISNKSNNELFLQYLEKQPNFMSNFQELDLSNLSLSLTHQPLSCPNGTLTLVTHPNLSDSNQTIKLFSTNGYLKYADDLYHPKEYCINNIHPDLQPSLEIIACNPNKVRPFIPKCCDMDQVWDLSLHPDGPIRCRPSGMWSWTPAIYSDLKSAKPIIDLQNLNQIPRLVITHPREWCRSAVNIYSLKSSFKFPKKDVFKILPDGNVWMKRDKWNWDALDFGTFCIDGGMNFREDENSTHSFSGNSFDTVLIDCMDRDGATQPCHGTPGATNAYAISLIVASLFLLVTVFVYILLWEKQNVHGYTSLAYFASMFSMYIFTALYRLDYLMFSQNETGYGCLVIAIGTHFFWLATFCWMSCVNFDLWWTFRALLPTGGKSKGLKRFLAYTVFSLGIPSLIVGVGGVLDYLYMNDIESEIITPEYGKITCFMDQKYALLPYLYGPIAVLLSANLAFFCVTIYSMHKIQQSTKFASSSSSKNPKQKESILLFAKLFLLMGVPWGCEAISWATTPCGEISWYWAIFDYVNIFQAVAIFLTFSCKSETINSLETKFPRFKRFMKAVSISPAKSDEFLIRHPNFKFLVKPFTRKKKNLRAVSSSKTVSTGADASSRQASTSHRTHFSTTKQPSPRITDKADAGRKHDDEGKISDV